MRTLAVELPLPARELCGNGYLPKFRGPRIVREHREAARLAGLAALRSVGFVREDGGPRAAWYFPSGRVRVEVTVRRAPWWSARRLDDDNLWRGCKPFLDGLQDVAVVADDRQFFLAGPVRWERPDTGAGGVTLTLRGERAEVG